jgi:hypothetical protein
MTEQEWLVCTDPTPVLEFLRGKASERKLRLFMVACCRRVWEWMPSEGRLAVEVCEQYADGRIGQKKLSVGRRAAYAASKLPPVPPFRGDYAQASSHAGVVALHACDSMKQHEACEVADWVERTARSLVAHMWADTTDKAERKEHCSWLRDLFGLLPFRPVSVSPSWLTWNDGTIPKLAQGIYDERAFDRLPILADALEESGCSDQDILGHCRGAGPHVRGCWVVDLLLGKE